MKERKGAVLLLFQDLMIKCIIKLIKMKAAGDTLKVLSL